MSTKQTQGYSWRRINDMKCECCRLERSSTVKYKGIGYYCDECMHEGCFSDDIDAQNPAGPWPTFRRQPDGRYLTDRQYAIHQRIAASLQEELDFYIICSCGAEWWLDYDPPACECGAESCALIPRKREAN